MPREGNRGFEIQERVARGIRNLGKFSLWNPESWALGSGKQLKKSESHNDCRIRNPRSTDLQNVCHSLFFKFNCVSV